LGERNYLSAEAIRQRTRRVADSEAQPGDLIFFQNTYDTPGASHIGVWLTPDKMLDTHHPGGVQITNIASAYWHQHFLALGRPRPLDGS
jgi:cell wall-associated NlpC family hydrolase